MSTQTLNLKFAADISEISRATKKITSDLNGMQKDLTSVAAKISLAVGGAFIGVQKAFAAISSPFKQFARYEDALVRLRGQVGSLEEARDL